MNFCTPQVSLALGLEVGGWGAVMERSSSGHGHSGESSLIPSGSLVSLAGLARRCGVCLAAFPSALLLQRHALLQHAGHPADDKPFTCEQCGQRYRYRSAYIKHREQNHRARLPADKLFTCDVCGMQFRYLKSFKKHRLNHALERLHKVPESQVGPAERSDQVSSTGEPAQVETNSDASVMDPEEPVPETSSDGPREETVDESQQPKPANPGDGEAAGTGGTSSEVGEADEGAADEDRAEPADTMMGILRSHDPERRERRFACPFCGKCVRSKENLKLHVRKHTGERPFVCLFCGRAFGGKSDLTRHLRIHTGERPYHCEMCGKCFARADYLSKHLTTHIHHR